MDIQRYTLVGHYQDNKMPCFLPDKDGDYCKFNKQYYYRPLVRDKVDDNRYRIRRLIKWLVLCNNPTWFTTLTHNDPAARQDFMKSLAAGSLFARRLSRYGCKVFLMPETDKNNNWHFHGFIFNELPKHLVIRKKHWKTGKPMTHYVRPLGKSLPAYCTNLWETGRNKLGYELMTSLSGLAHHELVGMIKYTGKYITKTIITIKTRTRYIRSRGLSTDRDKFLDKVMGQG